jgi:hypothetical protein
MPRIWLCMLLLVVVSCAPPLRPGQRTDIVRWEAEAARAGHPEIQYEKHLDPDHARTLGFAPFGLAGFYVNRPGLAVSGFTWPISLIWMPAKAYSVAQQENYAEFRERILALRQELAPSAPVAPTRLHRVPVDPVRATRQLERLEKLWGNGRISETEYLEQRQTIMESMTDERWEQELPHPVPRER